MFGGLSATVILGLWWAEYKYPARTLFTIPVAFCVVYGLGDEIHQLFVASRTFAVADIAADASGAAFATILLLVVLRKRT